MPFEWNNIIVVTKEELIPAWYNYDALQKNIKRYENKPYGIKRAQLGGNGRQLLIAFDSLPSHIQAALGNPRKLDHILEKFYQIDAEAVSYYAAFSFPDGSYLDMEYQERYIVNASVLKAIIALRDARRMERLTKGGSTLGIMSTLCADATSFNKTLKAKHGVEHTLPQSEKRFKQDLKGFETEGYIYLISNKHRNNNARKVNEATLQLLNSMFGKDKTKPTATEVHRQYKKFIAGNLEVINNNTGEVYNPNDFKELSPVTVTNYLAQWGNKIGTHAARSGDRQKLMQLFKPYHSLDKPQYAGSIISIDDRQPPFQSTDGKRIWFYNGIDLGSEAFTCWVYGRNKEGLILEFYRQLVRNYAAWGMNLPAELEAEMSLNSSFVSTFLREGAMFQHVRIEANNARGKRIEAYFKPLRYGLEKKREGWLARPFARSESNQTGAEKVPTLPYSEIVDGCLKDIETWNNMPHSVYPHLSRWDVFCQLQNPNLKPTNYQSILPHIGYKTSTSCNVGIIRLQNKEFLLGHAGAVATGDKLISLMKVVEGQNIDVYWLNDNQGQVFKALVFQGTQYICEAIAKPTYNRARIEQTEQDMANREIMSKYVATIEGYARRQKAALEPLTILDNTPVPHKSFVMPGLRQPAVVEANNEVEILPEIPEELDYNILPPPQSFVRSIKDRF
ncbi:MAG: hypothetical protein ACO1OF_14020 [Adhaeribacter sp.]